MQKCNTQTRQSTAVVIGASIGGLTFARVLSEHYDRVLIIEKETLSSCTQPRKSVPQGAQVHALLDKGREVLNELYPSLFARLGSLGALSVDFEDGLRWKHHGSWKVGCKSPFRMSMQSRPLLEREIRSLTLERANIELISAKVLGVDMSSGRFQCVRLRENGSSSKEARRIDADFLVDTSGRASQMPRWLREAGLTPPKESQVALKVTYSSRMFKAPQRQDDWSGLLIYPKRPDSRQHGIVFTVEEDRWLVTLMGYGEDAPPSTDAGFLEWAKGLDSPEIYDAIRHAEPLTTVVQHKFSGQRWRHYERLQNLPQGMVVGGDALCSLDPVFGQGMSVAILQAHALGKAMAAGQTSSRALQRRIAKVVALPWRITEGEAHRYLGAQEEATLPRSLRILHAFLNRIYARSAQDPKVYETFLSVMQMHQGIGAFANPQFLWRLFRPQPSQRRLPVSKAEHRSLAAAQP